MPVQTQACWGGRPSGHSEREGSLHGSVIEQLTCQRRQTTEPVNPGDKIEDYYETRAINEAKSHKDRSALTNRNECLSRRAPQTGGYGEHV